MKQIILLLMLSSSLYAQRGNSISVGVDPSNALFGSSVNEPAFDVQAKFTFRTEYDEYGLFVESFKEIDYFNWGIYWNANLWASDHYHTIPRWQILGGFEASQIIKKERTRSAGFWTGAANLIGRYNFGKYQTYGIEIQSNYEYRPEWTKWVYSTYINFIYHFEL